MWIFEHIARRWCILLALVITPFPVAAADRTFTLASWNIEHLAAADGQGCRGRDGAEYQAIRRYLEQIRADVIAFQEVENQQAAARIFPAADYDVYISARPTRTFSQCYDGPNHRLMQRTGFAVRKDLGNRLGLRAVRQPDVKALQGAYASGRWGVYLVLEPSGRERVRPTSAGSMSTDSTSAGSTSTRATTTPARHIRTPLHLLSIHLKSRCTYQSVNGRKANNSCRLLWQQVEVLADWIGARADAGQDFIIAGDFNRQLDQLSDEVWLRLEAGVGNAYVDLEKALHGMKHPQPYIRKYPFAIDHIIYNQALDALAIEEQTCFDVRAAPYSDHLPLISVFEMMAYD